MLFFILFLSRFILFKNRRWNCSFCRNYIGICASDWRTNWIWSRFKLIVRWLTAFSSHRLHFKTWIQTSFTLVQTNNLLHRSVQFIWKWGKHCRRLNLCNSHQCIFNVWNFSIVPMFWICTDIHSLHQFKLESWLSKITNKKRANFIKHYK